MKINWKLKIRNKKRLKRSLLLSFAITVTYFLFPILFFCIEPTTITGDKMRILQKGDILEFLGNVKLVQQNLTICADEMKSNEKTGIVEGCGNITIHYSSGTENTFAWCDVAEYDKNNGVGIFTGNVKVKKTLHRPSVKKKSELSKSLINTDDIDLTCEKLKIFESGNSFHAIKNVKIIQPQMQTTSNEAFYDTKTKEIFLTGGHPKTVRTDDKGYFEYSGDKIFLTVDKETVTILGNVKAQIVMK
ncbi:MAG: LptA/OstA family protein [Elusimicrobiota bacterium]